MSTVQKAAMLVVGLILGASTSTGPLQQGGSEAGGAGGGGSWGASTVAGASDRGASESTREVPDWMNTVCPTEDSVNCWYPGGKHGHAGPTFRRMMPGRTHMVCVMYVDHPRRDYCA